MENTASPNIVIKQRTVYVRTLGWNTVKNIYKGIRYCWLQRKKLSTAKAILENKNKDSHFRF